MAVINSPYPNIDIPQTNILTYLFGDGGVDASDAPLWIDVLDDKKSLSSRTALQWIKRLALGLDRQDVKPGEVVLTVTPNHIFVPIAFLGIVAGGRIFSGANPIYTADGKELLHLSISVNTDQATEICYQIKDTGARIILAHPSLLPTARSAAAKAGFPLSALYTFSDTDLLSIDGFHDWRSILASPSEASDYRWPEFNGEISKRQLATINYSSGTTGLPKGVMITHHNLVSNAEQSIYTKYSIIPRSRSPPERWLGFLPLYHAYGQTNTVMLAPKLRIPMYVMQNFDFERFLHAIQERKITNLQVAPPILVLLNKHPAVSKYDLTSIVQIICGAAPLSGSLQNEVSKRFNTRIGQGYGMTELTCSALSVPPGSDDSTGSVGVLGANSQAKLLDEKGNEVKTGERGEVYVRGPHVSPGYWKNEKATRETMLEDGWLRTGDVAIASEDGWFWIVDRLKVRHSPCI